jgi:hypothetical protein
MFFPKQRQRPSSSIRRNGHRKALSHSSNALVSLPQASDVDRERLYDDVMRSKMAGNMIRDENTRLRTKLKIAENEIAKKDRLIDDLMCE